MERYNDHNLLFEIREFSGKETIEEIQSFILDNNDLIKFDDRLIEDIKLIHDISTFEKFIEVMFGWAKIDVALESYEMSEPDYVFYTTKSGYKVFYRGILSPDSSSEPPKIKSIVLRIMPTYHLSGVLQNIGSFYGRSLADLFLICRYYFPKVTLRELISYMLPRLGTSICRDINKRLWNYNSIQTDLVKTRSQSVQHFHENDEYGKSIADYIELLDFEHSLDNRGMLPELIDLYGVTTTGIRKSLTIKKKINHDS